MKTRAWWVAGLLWLSSTSLFADELVKAIVVPANSASAVAVCAEDPLQGRALHLRGTFNSWNAADAQRFAWACNRYELVTRLQGEHKFKVGDEGWSADADFGRGPVDGQLAIKGSELRHTFSGVHRLTLRMGSSPEPVALGIESCPTSAPFGDTPLFLRGTMNNWAAQDDFAFQYSCDAYYLNVKLSADHDFKIADAAWRDVSSFGHNATAQLEAGAKGNVRLHFSGEQTLRLAFVGGKPVLSLGPKTFADPNARSVTDSGGAKPAVLTRARWLTRRRSARWFRVHPWRLPSRPSPG
jgi:cyclomaltodextrinase